MNILLWIFPVVPCLSAASKWMAFILPIHICFSCTRSLYTYPIYIYLKINCLLGEGAIFVYQQIICQMARFSKKSRKKSPKSLEHFFLLKKKLNSYSVPQGGKRSKKNTDIIRNLTLTHRLHLPIVLCVCSMFKHSFLPVCNAYNCCSLMKAEKEIMEDVTAAYSTHYKFSKAFKVSFSVLMHMAQVVWCGYIVQNWVCMWLCFSASQRTHTTKGSHFKCWHVEYLW